MLKHNLNSRPKFKRKNKYPKSKTYFLKKDPQCFILYSETKEILSQGGARLYFWKLTLMSSLLQEHPGSWLCF